MFRAPLKAVAVVVSAVCELYCLLRECALRVFTAST